MKLSVAIIAKDEEHNIKDCLDSVSWADEIVIIDSGSTDKTREIARGYTDRIFDVPFENFAQQKNAAVERAQGPWVLALDADERITPELRQAIQERVRGHGSKFVYGIRRHTYFFGKRLRFSGTQSDYPVRLFPKSDCRYEQPVHECIVSPLPVKRIEAPMLHFSTRDRSHYEEKLRRYLPLELEILKKRGRPASFLDPVLRPAATFVNLYFLKLGILDGWTGLRFAQLSAYYSFLKYMRHFRQAGRL